MKWKFKASIFLWRQKQFKLIDWLISYGPILQKKYDLYQAGPGAVLMSQDAQSLKEASSSDLPEVVL